MVQPAAAAAIHHMVRELHEIFFKNVSLGCLTPKHQTLIINIIYELISEGDKAKYKCSVYSRFISNSVPLIRKKDDN